MKKKLIFNQKFFDMALFWNDISAWAVIDQNQFRY